MLSIGNRVGQCAIQLLSSDFDKAESIFCADKMTRCRLIRGKKFQIVVKASYSAHSHFSMRDLVEAPIFLALVTTIFWAQIRPQIHVGYTTIVYGNLACAPLSHSGRSEI